MLGRDNKTDAFAQNGMLFVSRYLRMGKTILNA